MNNTANNHDIQHDIQSAGYYSQPSLAKQQLVFICEDDLWTVAVEGGVARRLTSNLGTVSSARISPDGAYIAFVGHDEGGYDLYIMPAQGGETKRLTFWGGYTTVVGWHEGRIIVSSNAKVMARESKLYAISTDGQKVDELPTGNALAIAFASNSENSGNENVGEAEDNTDERMLIARHTTDIARWKRYRGGRTGAFWLGQGEEWQELIRGDGKGLLPIAGNVASPMWLGARLYFISDHEGTGNIYSCTPEGEDLQRHSHHEDFYARNASQYKESIVYHAGADIYHWDVEHGSRKVDIQLFSPRVETKRKFVPAQVYLEDYNVHPKGEKVAVATRGKVFSFDNFEGAVSSHGSEGHVRYRRPVWLQDGSSFLLLSDASAEDRLEWHKVKNDKQEASIQRFDAIDTGRIRGKIAVSPTENRIAFANHRNEVCLFNAESGELQVIDKSHYGLIAGMDFSPDGKYLAYAKFIAYRSSVIMLCHLETGETQRLTRPTGVDMRPNFDPDGRFLYFISYRVFNPVWDSLHFELSFPRGSRPYLITLQADTPSPFERYEALKEDKKKTKASEDTSDDDTDKANEDKTDTDKANTNDDKADDAAEKSSSTETEAADDGKKDKKKITPVQIDLDNIEARTVAFPVKEARYNQIVGLKDKVIYSHSPVQGSLNRNWMSNTPAAKDRLECYDFVAKEEDTLISGISDFAVSLERKHLIYRCGNRLRVIKAGEKPKDDNGTGKKSGWLNLHRIKISVEPKAEWQQMLSEVWRLQRDLFWTEDMSGVDWQGVYARYAPLLARVSCRSEFTDLLWEMQGELGTSHAYAMGGDYAPEPSYPLGLLGAELRYHAASDSYEITKILEGDPWDRRESSPLARAGSKVKVGDRISAVNGQKVSRALSVQALLVNQAGNEVALTIQPSIQSNNPSSDASSDTSNKNESKGENKAEKKDEAFELTIRPLRNESRLRYREWVNHNRQQVHEASEGRIGYIHIPDMSPNGYAEFHHGWLLEQGGEREGLIVDVRFNGGGNVSGLLLEKLARRPLAHIEHRYSRANTYPYNAYVGPMVAITNEVAGSDGDIFSHAWKMLNLGPLIGKRTWGGVIGISIYDGLMDKGVTTQPMASFHFHDVGYDVENYGTDPTIEVDIRPEDYLAGRDPQLERAITEALQALEDNPPHQPDLASKPNLKAPTLPKLES